MFPSSSPVLHSGMRWGSKLLLPSAFRHAEVSTTENEISGQRICKGRLGKAFGIRDSFKKPLLAKDPQRNSPRPSLGLRLSNSRNPGRLVSGESSPATFVGHWETVSAQAFRLGSHPATLCGVMSPRRTIFYSMCY
jgi:hypothetical protein